MKTLVGPAVFFELEVNDTVRDLMTQIHLHDRFGHAPNRQRLIFKGHQVQDENKTMEDLRVEEGDQFHLVARLRGGARSGARTMRTARRFYMPDPPSGPVARRISVETLIGTVVFFKMDVKDTVRDLKIKIHLHDRLGHGVDQQCLIFRGRKLQDESKTMEDLRVEEGDHFHLVTRLRGGARTKQYARRRVYPLTPCAPAA